MLFRRALHVCIPTASSTSYLARYFAKVPQKNSPAPPLLTSAGLDHLTEGSPSIAQAIVAELQDQRSHLKLIASENYSSLAAQLAMGNWLTDKYAKGIPFIAFTQVARMSMRLKMRPLPYVNSYLVASMLMFSRIPVQMPISLLIGPFSFSACKIARSSVCKQRVWDTLSPEEYERIRKLTLPRR